MNQGVSGIPAMKRDPRGAGCFGRWSGCLQAGVAVMFVWIVVGLFLGAVVVAVLVWLSNLNPNF